jgi:aryl-alcohol dehydrogenase-like predicted oxidoreductase
LDDIVRTRRLGSRGPEVSVIGFGAWEAGGDDWGPNESESAVIDAIRTGPDAGMTWIDTAEVYGDGVSERLVGRAMSGRSDVLIATKVAPEPAGSGFRPEQVRAACDGSLRRLGVDTIDLYQLHWPDERGVPIEETWGAMAALVDEGKVRWIGVSNFDRPLIERCLAIRVLSYSPMGAGLLTGAVARDDAGRIDDWRAAEGLMHGPVFERALSIVDAMRPLAERLGITVAQLALTWNLAQPGVTAAIAGSRSPTHTRENAAAGDVDVDADVITGLEALLDVAAQG